MSKRKFNDGDLVVPNKKAPAKLKNSVGDNVCTVTGYSGNYYHKGYNLQWTDGGQRRTVNEVSASHLKKASGSSANEAKLIAFRDELNKLDERADYLRRKIDLMERFPAVDCTDEFMTAYDHLGEVVDDDIKRVQLAHKVIGQPYTPYVLQHD